MTDQHDAGSPKAPVEFREAAVAGVNFAQRTIEVIAVPYNEETVVLWRGEAWVESVDQRAFDGLEKRPNRVRVNRDHDKSRTVGKAVNFWPSREEGLVTEVRIAHTTLGDETLALADEDMLSASVGMAVRGSDQELDRRSDPPRRRVMKAFLDHLSFVESPAYEGARVLAVREDDTQIVDAATLPPLNTPTLDEWAEYLRHRRTGVAS